MDEIFPMQSSKLKTNRCIMEEIKKKLTKLKKKHFSPKKGYLLIKKYIEKYGYPDRSERYFSDETIRI